MEKYFNRLTVLSRQIAADAHADAGKRDVEANSCLQLKQQWSCCSETKNNTDLVLTDSYPNGCVVITLNKPKSLNSLNLEMIYALKDILERCRTDSSIKFVVIKGSGKSFCAGGDIAELQKAASNKDVVYPSQFFGNEYQLDYAIWNFPKPIISLWHGVVMGGGVGLSIGARYRVASYDCNFAMPEVKYCISLIKQTGIGFFPDVGASYFLTRGRLAKGFGLYMALTGARLNYKELIDLDIATHSIAQSQLPLLEQALTTTTDSMDVILAQHCDPPIVHGVQHMQCIEKYFGQPASVESIINALKGAGTEWSIKVAHTLSQKSPSSLKIVFKQLLSGSSWTLEQTFKMEYRIALHFMLSNDFVEGVRAVVISKDNKPRWSPISLANVTEEFVDKYFAPFSNIPDLELS